MHDEGGVQEEPRHRHGHDHVHGKSAHAVLRVGAALDEERRDGAGRQEHQAAVHGAVGDTVVGVGEVPQVIADDPEPQLVGPDEILLLAATDDDAKETADAQGVQDAGDAVDHVPGAADHHVAVHDAVDARELEVANAGLEDVDGEDDGRNADDVLLLEGREVHDEPPENRARQARVGLHPLEPRARARALDRRVRPDEYREHRGQGDEDCAAHPFVEARQLVHANEKHQVEQDTHYCRPRKRLVEEHGDPLSPCTLQAHRTRACGPAAHVQSMWPAPLAGVYQGDFLSV